MCVMETILIFPSQICCRYTYRRDFSFYHSYTFIFSTPSLRRRSWPSFKLFPRPCTILFSSEEKLVSAHKLTYTQKRMHVYTTRTYTHAQMVDRRAVREAMHQPYTHAETFNRERHTHR